MRSIRCRLGFHHEIRLVFNDDLSAHLCDRCRRLRFSFRGRHGFKLAELPPNMRRFARGRLEMLNGDR